MSTALPVYYSPTHQQHAPEAHADAPTRIDELLGAAVAFGASIQDASDFGIEPIAAVHSPGLLALLQTAYRRFAQLKEGRGRPCPTLLPCAPRPGASHTISGPS